MRLIVVVVGLLVVVGGVILGSFTSAQLVVGGPLPGLTADEHQRFLAGRMVFERTFTPETGLGPQFNSTSCAACHESPAVGGAGTQAPGGDDVEVHATRLAGGVCDPLTDFGGPAFQQQVVPGAALETIPANAQIGRRITPALFGMGLLEAIPDDTLLALQQQTGGRVHRLPDGRIGRFGRKAESATLVEFTTGAFRDEQGIEVNETGIDGRTVLTAAERDLTADFVRFLAPPEPLPLNLEGQIGAFYFRQIGCATCHVPLLVTGPSQVAALNQRRVVMWSDLLLHDMGPALADVCLGDARPQEFRTEPLAGLRFRKRFLHDGRALTLESAIVQHGGAAHASTNNWSRLPGFLKEFVLTFLRSL